MKTMKEQMRKFFSGRFAPFFLLAVLALILHFVLKINTGDDVFYLHYLDQTTYLKELVHLYHYENGRILINAVLLLIVHHPWLWRLWDIVMLILAAIAISVLVPGERQREKHILIVLLMLVYPFIDMSSAGWVATTVNYLWPLALGLIALIPLKKAVCKQNIHWWEYFIYIPALIYAVSSEQMCLLLCGIYTLCCVYLIVKHRFRPLVAIQSGLALLGLIVFLASPATSYRYDSEIARWFPEYVNLSIINKLDLGFSSTLYHFVMAPDFIFLCLCVLLFLCVLQRKPNRPGIVFCSALPLFGSLIFGFGGDYFGRILPSVATIRGALIQSGTGLLWFSPFTWIPDLVLLGVCFMLAFSIYHCFDNNRLALLNVLILLAGLCSRLIMGFSPTIWASADRTFIFMYFAIIICCVFLGMELLKMNRSWFYRSCALLTVFALLTYLNNLYQLPL